MSVAQTTLYSLRTPALWMIGASLAFTGMASCMKLAAEHGVPNGQILFFRGAVALVLIATYQHLRRIPFRTPHLTAHIQRGLVGFTSMLLYVTAISLLPLATAVTLNYLSPLVLALLLVTVYDERAHPAMSAALLGGLAGVVLLLQPTFEASQWVGGVVGLASAVTGALVALNIRKLGRLNEPPTRTVTYFSLIVTLGATPWLILGGPMRLDVESLTYVLGAGLFATGGQAMLTLAYQYGQTMLVSLLGYSQVVFTSLLTMLIWNDRLSWLSWAGMALVIVSGVAATIAMRPQPKPAEA